MSLAGCQIDLNFHLQKCLEILDKNLSDKIQWGVNLPCLIPMIISFAFKHCHYNNLTITKPDYIKNKTQKLFCCAITVFGSMYVFKHCHNNNLKSTELTFIHMDNRYHIKSLEKKIPKNYLVLDNFHD